VNTATSTVAMKRIGRNWTNALCVLDQLSQAWPGHSHNANPTIEKIAAPIQGLGLRVFGMAARRVGGCGGIKRDASALTRGLAAALGAEGAGWEAGEVVAAGLAGAGLGAATGEGVEAEGVGGKDHRWQHNAAQRQECCLAALAVL